LRLYLDSSALVKRYVDEEGSDVVRVAMATAEVNSISWVGCVETIRAVGRAAGASGVGRFQSEQSTFDVVDFDRTLADRAGRIGWSTGLRSLDAMHLAAALSLSSRELFFATWDTRLHRAAREHGLQTLPADLG
jgi:uncharacterized protein